MSDTALIPLRARDGSVRACVIVDAADADWLNQWRWSLCAGYASRKESRSLAVAYPRTLLMHREILGLAPGDARQGDHINRNPLGNRRANLRAITKAENCQNVPARKGTSPHRGVFREGRTDRWRATVQVNRVVHNLGSFATEEEAAAVAAGFRAMHMPYAGEEVAA